jgi:hypothetical protein
MIEPNVIQKLVLVALASQLFDQNSRRQLCQNQFLNHVRYKHVWKAHS